MSARAGRRQCDKIASQGLHKRRQYHELQLEDRGRAVVALLLAGCGSESCPSVAGTWKIVGYCESSLVNRTVTVSQSGCAITYTDPFPGWTGTISAAGLVTVTGPRGCAAGSPPRLLL